MKPNGATKPLQHAGPADTALRDASVEAVRGVHLELACRVYEGHGGWPWRAERIGVLSLASLDGVFSWRSAARYEDGVDFVILGPDGSRTEARCLGVLMHTDRNGVVTPAAWVDEADTRLAVDLGGALWARF